MRLVDSTRLAAAEGPERRVAMLAEHGIDALNMHQTDWTGGLTTLVHRFERYAPSSGPAARAGCTTWSAWASTASSDSVDRMIEAVHAVSGSGRSVQPAPATASHTMTKAGRR